VKSRKDKKSRVLCSRWFFRDVIGQTQYLLRLSLDSIFFPSDGGFANLFRMNFEEELNPEQLAAVTAPDGPSLVVAAAGTGKTRTLIYRLAWLAKVNKTDPKRVLLLTFTNKAAREMLKRSEILIGQPFTSKFSGTFHHFANYALRIAANRVGFGRDFTILDQDDAKKLLRSCAEELGVNSKNFPKPEVLLSLFGVVCGNMGDFSVAVRDRFEFSEVDPEDVLKVRELYQERKKSQNAMDFDDLLVYAFELLKENEDIRTYYQQEFQYVLVDEYQDTNTIQAELVHLLVEGHENIMVVGDDFQSIYSWRGANFRNFLDFKKIYPRAKIYKLQINYRSSPEILDVANKVIAGNPGQFQKEMRAVRDSGERPRLVILRDGSAQARYIIGKVQNLQMKGVRLSDICVLYRSHFHAMELQMELARAQLPYMVTSGVRFFEQAHIKDVCAPLRLLVNPGDELAFTRLLELFPRVGKRSSIKIFRKLGDRANFQLPETREKMLELLPAAAREQWEKVQEIFVAYRDENLREHPGEIIYRFKKVFYDEYMVETFENYKYRAEDLDGLIDFTAKFSTVEDFLSEIALLTNLDAETDTPDGIAEGDTLRLSTIHQAKGLEWKVVFVLFMCEDMFPSKKAIEENDDTEERRLFYVAVTRAKDDLFICVPRIRRQRDGGIYFLEPSRFIKEIPGELLQEDGGFY